MNKVIYTLGVLATLSQSSLAVFPFLIQTDGDGDFLPGNGSYTGNGSVQADVEANVFTVSGLQQSLLVDDLSSGTLSFDTAVDNPLGPPHNQQRIVTDLSAQISVSFEGGTGDLYVNNSAQWDGGDDKFNSLGLQDLGGVTSITFRVSYDQFIAGRFDETSNLSSRPMLAALGLVNAGAGLVSNQFNVQMDYDIVRFSTDGINFSDTPVGTSVHSAGFTTVSPDGLSYAADGFPGLVIPGDQPTNQNFLIVKGFDVDGVNSYDPDDAPKVYARQQTWTITPANGASTFADDTHFTFSMDGSQFGNIDVVPETSATALGLLAGLIALGGRRRKDS